MTNKPTLSIRIDDDTELRILEERYAQELFNLIDQHRSYLREWLPWLDYEQSIEDTKAFIRNSLQQFVNNEGFQAGIWYKGKLVGGIGYHPINWIQHKVEVGYWLSENAQGKGIMTRACKTMITYAFEVFGLHRVEIHCATENKPSRAIPERLGFKQDGILREDGWLYDHYVDHIIYSMLEQEWEYGKQGF